MNAGTQEILLALTIILLLLISLALANWLLGLRARALVADYGAESQIGQRVNRLRNMLGVSTWYLAVILGVAVLVALFIGMIGWYQFITAEGNYSELFARNAIEEQKQSLSVTGKLKFEAQDELTPVGGNPTSGQVFLISAALKDYGISTKKCTPNHLRDLTSDARVELHSINFTSSSAAVEAPILEQYSGAPVVCGVKWTWVVSTSLTGPSEAIVSLTFRNRNGTMLYRAKRLRFGAGTVGDWTPLIGAIPSIAVALISLLGALFTAMLGARNARIGTNGPHVPNGDTPP